MTRAEEPALMTDVSTRLQQVNVLWCLVIHHLLRFLSLVQPKITYLSNQTASEYEDQVTLTCEASGDPTPTISWSFENRVFTEGEQVQYEVENVQNIQRYFWLIDEYVTHCYSLLIMNCTLSNDRVPCNRPISLFR